MRKNAHDYGLKHGHDQIAEKVILIDWDGTITKWGPLYNSTLLEESAESLRAFKEAGYRVVIFTSRLSPVWLESAEETAERQIDYITKVCADNEIPFDYITSEKIPAVYYIDDRAIEYKYNWPEIRERILGK